ncbi:hypothetical protein PG987_006882 [Apiospora arundinis]
MDVVTLLAQDMTRQVRLPNGWKKTVFADGYRPKDDTDVFFMEVLVRTPEVVNSAHYEVARRPGAVYNFRLISLSPNPSLPSAPAAQGRQPEEGSFVITVEGTIMLFLNIAKKGDFENTFWPDHLAELLAQIRQGRKDRVQVPVPQRICVVCGEGGKDHWDHTTKEMHEDRMASTQSEWAAFLHTKAKNETPAADKLFLDYPDTEEDTVCLVCGVRGISQWRPAKWHLDSKDRTPEEMVAGGSKKSNGKRGVRPPGAKSRKDKTTAIPIPFAPAKGGDAA